MQKKLNVEVTIYIIGGLITAAVDVGTMKLLLLNGATAVYAATGGFLASILTNYLFHAKITFGKMASRDTFFKYVALVCMNYLLTICIVYLATHLAASPMTGKVISMPVVATIAYLLSKFWVYK
jgi:putative flippase GtrA